MNILLLAPQFHNYHECICDEVKKNGDNIYWENTNLAFNTFDRIIYKINRKKMVKKYNKYFASIVEKYDLNMFDKVVVIFGGNLFNATNVMLLKNRFPDAQLIYYAWDSVKNYPNILSYYHLFDYAYSFDNCDCKEYGFGFLPLFYRNKEEKADIIYDYCLIMTASIDKIKIFKKMNTFIKKYKGFVYLYFYDKKRYWYNKILHPQVFRNLDKSLFRFSPLNKDEVNFKMAQSKVIIDIPLENQKGLTIRTFEALKLNKKIITTNAEIKKYSFYNHDDICVFSDGVNNDFFSNKNGNYCINDYSASFFTKQLIYDYEMIDYLKDKE